MGDVAADSERKRFMDFLSSGYKREVLEELVDNPDYMFTVNELAERVSGSYNSVNSFLRDLEEFDIVSFRRKGGSYLVEYSHDSRYHDAIKTLLRADNAPLEEAAERYAGELYSESGLSDCIRSIVLFGSVARGTAGSNSDVDILVLVNRESDVEDIKQRVRREARGLDLDFELVPVVESVEEFRDNLAHGKRFETNVEKDGIVLEGEELEFKD